MGHKDILSLTIGQVNVYEYGLVGRTLAPSSILVTYDDLARGWGSAYDRKVNLPSAAVFQFNLSVDYPLSVKANYHVFPTELGNLFTYNKLILPPIIILVL